MGAPTNSFNCDTDPVLEGCPVLMNAEAILLHRDWLLTVLATRLRQYRDIAEDLFNNLVAELVAGKHDLTQVESFEPWLYRLTVNKANDWLRSEQRARAVQEKLAIFQEHAQSVFEQPLPLDVLIDNERSLLLRQALDSMEVEDDEILHLKYLHDWNYAQLEMHLGLSQYQVTHRLRQARLKMKQVLLQLQEAAHWAQP